MTNYDIILNKTIDQFLTESGYDNVPWTQSQIFVSEGATLSQSALELVSYLYVVDLTLGENSIGSAILKTGFLSITKPDFDLVLVPVGAPVPEDVISPNPAEIYTALVYQDGTIPQGRSVVTLQWTLPTLSEVHPQYLGVADGLAQTFDLTFDPISIGSEVVFEITGYALGGGNTVLSQS
jgi:hypothetical protein